MSESSAEGTTQDGSAPLAIKGSRFVPALLVGGALLAFLAGGIQWSERVTRSASAEFSTNGADFRDFDALAARLIAPPDSDRLSRFLLGELADSTRRALGSASTAPPRRARVAMLATDLNRILESGFSLYAEERFPPDTAWRRGFSLRLQTVSDWEQLPGDAEHALVVARSEEQLRVRVINFPGEYIDYSHAEPGEPDSRLQAVEALVAPYFSAGAAPRDTARLTSEILDLLGYTGLSLPIDEERRALPGGDGDYRWLNRLLLEHAYGEIQPKFRTGGQQAAPATGWRALTAGLRRNLVTASMAFSRWVADDVPLVIRFQFRTLWILALYSLIPGIAGLIFRRSFGTWFFAAFAILFLVNLAALASKSGGIAADLASQLTNPYGFYLWIEAVLVLIVLTFRLQRHSAAVIDPRTRRQNLLLALVLLVLAAALGYGMWAREALDPYSLGGAVLLALVARGILQQSTAANRQPVPGKNIVMCLDGTWNQPGTKDFGYLAETNVYKLFGMLKGVPARAHYNASRSKEYIDGNRVTRQVAFYYHGVGNAVENSQLGQLLGGAFGMGAEAIVERAYLDIVRVYRPGDRIFIFGFSRGAAIARLLAGALGRRDVPRSLWTLRLLGRHRSVWRSAERIDPDQPVKVDVLGCWDTVGAFGLSKNILGVPFQRINLLKDLNVSLCVKRAYHMVALDETRDSFEPTLMDADPHTPERVLELWFAGNHSNVGGGYSTPKLSDVALDFLLRHLSSGYAWTEGIQPGQDERWGLYLSAARAGVGDSTYRGAILDPDPSGQLRFATGAVYAHRPRTLPMRAVIHESVFQRMAQALPIYAPQSLFNLNEALVRVRGELETEVTRLADTGSISAEESREIVERGRKHLFLMKWSDFLESPTADGVPLRTRVNPAEELRNPA